MKAMPQAARFDWIISAFLNKYPQNKNGCILCSRFCHTFNICVFSKYPYTRFGQSILAIRHFTKTRKLVLPSQSKAYQTNKPPSKQSFAKWLIL